MVTTWYFWHFFSLHYQAILKKNQCHKKWEKSIIFLTMPSQGIIWTSSSTNHIDLYDFNWVSLSQVYCWYISGTHQLCLRYILCNVPGIPWAFLKYIWGVFQIYFRLNSRIPESFHGNIHILGKYQVYFRYISGISEVYLWDILIESKAYFRHILCVCLVYLRCISDIYPVYFWNTSDISQVFHIWNILGISHIYLRLISGIFQTYL